MDERRSLVKKLTLVSVLAVLLITGIVLATLMIVRKINGNEKSEVTYYDKKVASFGVQNANLSQGQIVFIGDSITDLYHLDDYYADLDKATYNRGIGGDTTSGVYNRLKVSLYDIAPEKIVLMIGINDINGGSGNDEIFARYKMIVNEIATYLPSSKLICVSVLPMNTDVGFSEKDLKKRNDQVDDLNVKIKALCDEKNLTYVDLYSAVKDDSGSLVREYSVDGIHLSPAGFAVWTQKVKPLL